MKKRKSTAKQKIKTISLQEIYNSLSNEAKAQLKKVQKSFNQQ